MIQVKKTILKQFGNPSGFLGSIAGFIMLLKNLERSEWTAQKLNVGPNDILMEIGYGPGVTIGKVASKLTSGYVFGIDHSKLMKQKASGRNRKYIQNGRMKLKCGTIWDFNLKEGHFDKIYGSNVHFFWEDPVKEFSRFFELLKPGGILLMVFQPRWAKTEEDIKQIAVQTKNRFENAGFSGIEIDFKKMNPVTCISISGNKQL